MAARQEVDTRCLKFLLHGIQKVRPYPKKQDRL